MIARRLNTSLNNGTTCIQVSLNCYISCPLKVRNLAQVLVKLNETYSEVRTVFSLLVWVVLCKIQSSRRWISIRFYRVATMTYVWRICQNSWTKIKSFFISLSGIVLYFFILKTLKSYEIIFLGFLHFEHLMSSCETIHCPLELNNVFK